MNRITSKARIFDNDGTPGVGWLEVDDPDENEVGLHLKRETTEAERDAHDGEWPTLSMYLDPASAFALGEALIAQARRSYVPIPEPRRGSADELYGRLLRGENVGAEYAAAVKREVGRERDAARASLHLADKLAREVLAAWDNAYVEGRTEPSDIRAARDYLASREGESK